MVGVRGGGPKSLCISYIMADVNKSVTRCNRPIIYRALIFILLSKKCPIMLNPSQSIRASAGEVWWSQPAKWEASFLERNSIRDFLRPFAIPVIPFSCLSVVGFPPTRPTPLTNCQCFPLWRWRHARYFTSCFTEKCVANAWQLLAYLWWTLWRRDSFARWDQGTDSIFSYTTHSSVCIFAWLRFSSQCHTTNPWRSEYQ